MKKTSRFLAVLLAFCVAAAAFPPAGMAAEELDLRTLLDQTDFDGVLNLNGQSVVANDVSVGGSSQFAPFLIDKPVTIQNGTVSIRTKGIVLGANVTFSNVEFSFASWTEGGNFIAANGHTLTLRNNITCQRNSQSFNIYCGALTDNTHPTVKIPAPGSKGSVIIDGNVSIQGDLSASGNIYAGNVHRTNDGSNQTDFTGDASISILTSKNNLGAVYACGATQDKADATVNESFTVSGTVSVTGNVPYVYGTGSATTEVVYQGSGDQELRLLHDISSLSVKSGNLALISQSTLRDGQSLSISSGAKLDLSPMTGVSNLVVKEFNGNGYLILGMDQTWELTGSVEGKTTVAIDSILASGNHFVSGTIPTAGHTYIHAPNSQDSNFELLPPASNPSMKLVRDDSGNWKIPENPVGNSKLVSLAPENTQVSSGSTEAYIPLNPDYINNNSPLDLSIIPLTISFDNSEATRNTDGYGGYYYSIGDLNITAGLFQDDNGNDIDGLSIATAATDGFSNGTYKIGITVPGAYTESQNDITASCTLTVGDKPDPGPILIPVPTAITGLRWTGEEQTGVSEGTGYSLTGHKATDVGNHTATATLRADYQWTDNSTEAKTIPWSIAKAAGPAAPAKLSATAPTSAGGNDGKITGTTAEMEYASKENFSDKKDCGAVETTGLAAGTYYVRVKETETHEAGSAAPIIVPAYTAAEVTKIAVNSTAHKTEYQVGESLDVTNLTIKVTYSDQTMQTVSVTENMVGGFDSSRAAENQSLTITYGGKTTTYTVNITANQQPGGETHKLTVSHTGSGGTAPGDYQYAEGASVTVQAGARSGYTFSAWDAVGVTLNRGVPDVTFEMPAGDVTLSVIWRPNSITPPGHVHAWDTAWSSNGTHHWHDCTASGCSIGSSAQKSGYAPHTAGDWVVDRAATSTQSGTRHRDCTVCGYEMARETIPATGGGSGGSGSSGGSGGSGSSSSGGSSSGGSASSSGGTRNPDGSTTSTSTNRITGTVTQTTRRTDGSSTVVETRRDGTVATTDTAADGSTVKTVSRPNGAVETTVRQAGGLTATVQQRPGGDRASVRIPTKLAEEGGGIALPIPALSGENAYVTVRTGSSRPTTVEIPVAGNTATTVAYVTGDGGGETLVKTAVLSGGQITVSVPDGAAVRIRDNRKSFQDTGTHWARSAIDFVSSRELFSGTSAGTFSPDAPMSRAMLSTVLARLDGADLSGGSAYQKGVAWAVSQGISDGRSPSGQVTREQLVTMLYRYAGSPAATDRELRFSDAENISSYAREAIRWAAENGILSGYGDGSFAPKGRATRGQAAAILERYMRWLSQR